MISLMYEYLVIILPLAWLLVASFQDIKKREVANWLSFSLLSFGIAINIIFSIINKNFGTLVPLAIILIIFIILSLLLYYGRIFGGGDAKLLIALSPFLLKTPSFFNENIFLNFPFVITFLLNTVFIGSIYGLTYSAILAINNRKTFLKNFKSKKKDKKIIFIFIIFSILSLISLFFFLVNRIYLFLLIFFVLLFLPLLFIFIKAVEESSMLVLVETKKLTEGDWLAEKIKIGKRWIRPSEGLSMEEIKLLKKYKKKILIKQGIPFIPIFFIAFLISLFFNLLIEVMVKFIQI